MNPIDGCVYATANLHRAQGDLKVNLLAKPRIIAMAMLALLLFAASAQAQQYPNRPIRMICPAGPGTLDILTRTISQKLSEF
ncbi:MAG TPA: hypothetical protein VIK33_18880, partial [Anaerolineae bacterium]